MKKLFLFLSFLLAFFLSAEAFAECVGTITACSSRASYSICVPFHASSHPTPEDFSGEFGCGWSAANRCTGVSPHPCYTLTDDQCPAFAGCEITGTVNNNMLVSTICKGLGIVTGTFGKVVAAFAVISVGIGFFTGKVSWGLMIGVTAGIAAMFGANTIVAAVSGSSVASCS